jgi:hypothetical protein
VKKLLFLSFILSFVSCKKDLTGTDYDQLIGKYKLVYTLRFAATTYDRLNPTDNYEIDFNRNGKVYKIKNGHCESKEKVEDCNINSSATSTLRYVNLYLKDKPGSVEMYLPLHPGTHDTLVVGSYYPYEDDPNQTPYRYGHYYVKE